jgi:hypothetical protein
MMQISQHDKVNHLCVVLMASISTVILFQRL